MPKKICVLFSALSLLFSVTANAAPSEDDNGDLADSVMTLYLIFAVPEACAQVYPELKQPVNDFRAKFAKQLSGGNSSATDTVLPKDAQKEISACLNKQSVLSKGQCSRLIDVFSTGLSSETPESQQDEKAFIEMETLLKGGRQMIAGCADQKEKQLRQSSL